MSYDDELSIAAPIIGTISDVFFVVGRGLVVALKALENAVHVGDSVGVYRNGKLIKTSVVTGIEMSDVEGRPIGLLIRGLVAREIVCGDEIRGMAADSDQLSIARAEVQALRAENGALKALLLDIQYYITLVGYGGRNTRTENLHLKKIAALAGTKETKT